MRTTLNLDDDVVRQVTAMARAEGRSISRVANALIRDGLRLRQTGPPHAPYEAPVFDSGAPLVDVTDVQQALERLDEHG
jgi:ribbon-helix-helix CopG family protein